MLRQHFQMCLSLKDEAFSTLIRNIPISVCLDNGTIEDGYYVPDNPDTYNGFMVNNGLWTGGAAIKIPETKVWHIFVVKENLSAVWKSINDIRPTGMPDISIPIWKETANRTLNMFSTESNYFLAPR